MISDVQAFTLWFIEQVPSFLMAEPICYFVGFGFLIITISVIKKTIHLN